MFRLRKNTLLYSIILIGILLRLVGLIPGFPPYHPDEGMSYAQAAAIIKDHNLDAHGYAYPYAYPSLIPWINALIYSYLFVPLFWLIYFLTHIDQIDLMLFSKKDYYEKIFQVYILGSREVYALFWTRIITATFGIGVVILTYILTREIFSENKSAKVGSFLASSKEKIGLIAAFFVAVNYRLVLNSHIGLPDTYNAFFLLISLIFSYRLMKKPSTKNYVLAGFWAGISFATKFQIYSFIGLMMCHFFSLNSYSIKNLISKKILIAFLVTSVTVIILNPFHLLHWTETKEELESVARKYSYGKNQISFFSYSYLYNIGIGKLLSILSLLGAIFGLKFFFKKTFTLITIILFSLYLLTYYTNGGFYTRNFITIMPLILIFASIGCTTILYVIEKFITHKSVTTILSIILVIAIAYSNITNSTIAVLSYSKPWNMETLSRILTTSIPEKSRIAAHSSVPLPIKDVERLAFEQDTFFSLDEFREEGADYAIATLDTATNDFYWWMNRSPNESLKFWSKPISILEQTFPALSLREMSDVAIYSVIKPWQAPDSNFIVVKIPSYKVINTELKKSFSFEDGLDGWQVVSIQTEKEQNKLILEDNALVFKGPTTYPDIHWESPAINIEGWGGFMAEAEMMTKLDKKEGREGYIVACFYTSLKDAQLRQNRLGVRLTSRNSIFNKWVKKELVGTVPNNARFVTLSFQSYGSPDSINILRKIDLYKADVKVDYFKHQLQPIYLDTNTIFPNSHGNL